MKLLKSILILILLSNLTFAQSTIVKKGETVPYDGILLTKERAEKAMKAEKAEAVLRDLRTTHESIIKFHKEDAQRQREKLSRAEFKSSLYNIGYFVLGVVMASYAFKIQQEINK